jgi:hypothetical protein
MKYIPPLTNQKIVISAVHKTVQAIFRPENSIIVAF